MPKRVDPQQRREEIATALMRVAADRGLESVSLRRVAAEAGVTAGMVQHYFSNKESMLELAMQTARARFAARMTGAIERLDGSSGTREVVGTVLRNLLPLDEPQRADARVALAYQSYAATRRTAAQELAQDDDLRDFVSRQLGPVLSAGEVPGGVDPGVVATALLAVAQGLAVMMLTGGLDESAALEVVDAQLDLVLGRPF